MSAANENRGGARETIARRSALALGIAACAIPTWMASSFAQGQAREPGGAKRLLDAIAAAKNIGKPLLVIVVPAEPARRERGRIWGRFFANANDEAMLDLAVCEVACATRADVVSVLGKEPIEVHDGDWAVLVETQRTASVAKVIGGALPDVKRHVSNDDEPEAVRAQIATLASLLRRAIVPDAQTIQRRYEQSLGSIRDDSMRSEEMGILECTVSEQSPVRLRDLDRLAAMMRWTVKGAANPKRETLVRLAEAARVRLFEYDPPGARWHIVSNHCPPCGMGFTPQVSRYFLEFYTE